MAVRLIATDVDGTLLNRERLLPPENITAIRKAQEKGVTVAICSGRFPENVYLLLRDGGLCCPIIGINGGCIVDERLTPLSSHYMGRGAAMAVQRLLEEAGAHYFIFNPQIVCTSDLSVRHHSELSAGERIRALGVSYVHGTEAARECARLPVYKFFISNRVPLEPLREKLRTIPGISLTQSNPANIEVMPAGVDKASGITEFANIMGVSMDDVMTLGDEENDIPMLRAAGIGVAMGNACPAAKAAARYVTESNDRGGFALALERFA